MAGDIPTQQPEKKVKVTGTTTVKPRNAAAIGRQEYRLVTFDLPYLAFYYNQKLMVYKTAAPEKFDAAVEELKEGLSIVLDDFYQLAGKLGKDEDGVFRVEYDVAADGGVEVALAAAEEIAVADLSDVEGSSKFKELIPYNTVLNIEGLHCPLLSIQLTKLKDGLAIGCAFNHAVLDGTATWHFMSSWAQICSGATTISVPPFLDRTAIDQIKAKVNEKPPSDGSKPFSTFQSLSTHVWHAATRARQLKPEDYTVFTVFADCRKRVDPEMPESYFGNLIQAIFTVTAAGFLLAHPPEFGAGLIQKAIEAHDAKMIDARNKEWESNPKIFAFKDAGVNCVAVGSSPRFKVYEVDFGFGKPEVVRSGPNNRFDGMVYLYPGKAGGKSIDVEITLESSAMERLEKDKEFLMEEA